MEQNPRTDKRKIKHQKVIQQRVHPILLIKKREMTLRRMKRRKRSSKIPDNEEMEL